jgi:calcineurin-like phosphoesterase
MPIRYEVATGDIQMNALFIEVDSVSGRAVSVARRRYRLEH